MLISHHEVPDGAFVVEAPEGLAYDYRPVGPAHLQICPPGVGDSYQKRLFTGDQQFAVIVKKEGEPTSVLPAKYVQDGELVSPPVPIPHFVRGNEGRSWVRLSKLIAQLGANAAQILAACASGHAFIVGEKPEGLAFSFDHTPAPTDHAWITARLAYCAVALAQVWPPD